MSSDQTPPEPGRKQAREKSLTHRTVDGLLWSVSGSLVQIALRMVVLAILARLLTPAEFGIVGAAMIIISLTEIFGHLGVAQAVIQRPNLTEQHIRSGIVISLLFGLVTGILLYLLADPISRLLGIEESKRSIELLALCFPLKGLSSVAEALLTRWMNFKAISLINVVSYVLGYAPITLILAYHDMGVIALIVGQLAQVFLTSALQLYFARHHWGVGLNKKASFELLFFGGGQSLARIGNQIAQNADYFVVARWLGAEALGIYTRAYQIMMQPTNVLASTAERVLFPAMSSIQSQHERIAYGYKMTVAMIAMTTLPTSAVLIVFAPEIIRILLGSQWTAAIIPFQILSATLVCRTGYKAIGTLARAKGAIYQTAWRQFLYAGMVICGALLGQNYGVNGVAAGVAGAIAIQFLVMHSFGLRISGIKAMELVTIHARHLAATLALTSTIVSCKLVMASFGWGDIPVLMTGLAAAGAVYLLMLIGLPRIFGEEGIWAKKILSQYGERALQFAKRA